jgi:hypothetical protein
MLVQYQQGKTYVRIVKKQVRISLNVIKLLNICGALIALIYSQRGISIISSVSAVIDTSAIFIGSASKTKRIL